MEKLVKILTDPISNRLIQLIRTAQRMTISEILSQAPDVPRATVYRRMEKMLQAGVIEIVETHKVRGQTENVYAIRNIFISAPKEPGDGMKLMASTLMQIYSQCDRYFRREDADVERDKLFVLNYAIPLSDPDFANMLSEIYIVVQKYQQKPASADTPLRNLYLMSMPTEADSQV